MLSERITLFAIVDILSTRKIAVHDPPFGCPSECSTSGFLVDAVQDVVAINFFDSLDAMKRFAGPDYQVAEFEPEVRRLLSRIEPVANHYEVRVTQPPL